MRGQAARSSAYPAPEEPHICRLDGLRTPSFRTTSSNPRARYITSGQLSRRPHCRNNLVLGRSSCSRATPGTKSWYAVNSFNKGLSSLVDAKCVIGRVSDGPGSQVPPQTEHEECIVGFPKDRNILSVVSNSYIR
jgi:hypothetical protein